MQAFETLSLLEGTSNCTALAIESGTRLRSEDKADLDYYFNKACFHPCACTVDSMLAGGCMVSELHTKSPGLHLNKLRNIVDGM